MRHLCLSSILHTQAATSSFAFLIVLQHQSVFRPNKTVPSHLSSLSISSVTLQLKITSGCFACGTTSGFVIYNVEPFRETFRRTFTSGGTVQCTCLSLWAIILLPQSAAAIAISILLHIRHFSQIYFWSFTYKASATLSSFFPSSLPFFLPSYLPSFLHSFFHSFIPSFLPYFIFPASLVLPPSATVFTANSIWLYVRFFWFALLSDNCSLNACFSVCSSSTFFVL